MMIKRSYSAIVSLMLLPLIATAQDDETNADVIAGPLEQSVPVADEVAPPPPQTSVDPEEQLMEEFARYRRLVQEGTFDEADIAAKRIVEMAIRVYGPQSRETASALNNLGIVQHSNGQFDAAIQNFTSSVEIIEIVEDRLNDALVNPLKGLGAAQLGNGRPDLAQKTFTRAAHITHVNEGPHNLDQVEILESIAETFIRMGDTKEARKILDRIHIINVKYFEKNPMGLLPTLMNRASWQHRAGYYAEERSSYRRAIRIVESSAGNNDPMLVEPLRRLGESFYYVDVSMASPQQQQGILATGEMYFKRASRIAEKSKDFSWRELAETKVALADYYTFTEAHNRSRKIYRQVWELLSADEERLALRNELFADPVAIRAETLPLYAGGIGDSGSSRKDLIAGKIVVTYSVSTRGRVRELQTEAIPAEFVDMQRMVHREIRRRMFRPRIVDGVAADSEALVFEHAFSYVQSDLDALRAAKLPTDSEQKADDKRQNTAGD
jgi:tetratricopeptide (TPR) repeat protein